MSTRKTAGRRIAVERLERRDLLAFGLLGKNVAAVASVAFTGEVALLSNSSTTFSAEAITIDWGDGTPLDTTSGELNSPTSFDLGILEVDASHTYAATGAYGVTVTVTSQTGESESATLTANVTPPELTIAPNALSGTAFQALGASTTGNPPTVANFLDPALGDLATGFTALITWGDGKSSPGKVAGSKGVFTVSGDHTYAAAGSYTFTVSVIGNGEQASTEGTATIAMGTAPPAPTPQLPYKVTPIPVVEPPSTTPGTIPVATLNDPNASPVAAANLTALITWGDGDTSQGVVTGQGGTYTISGDYAYANPGTYPIAVTITNNLTGQTASGTTAANIVNTANAVGTTSPFAFSVGLAPIPGNGPNAASGLTNTNRPTFSGTAQPFAIVALTANRLDVDAPLPLGQAIADGTGHWSLPVDPMADGIYDVTATVTPPGGYPQLATNPAGSDNTLDQFIVDTQRPSVIAVSLLGQTGNVVVTLDGGLSGLDLLSLLNPANYEFIGPKSAKTHPISVTPVYTGTSPTDTQSIILVRSGKSKGRQTLHKIGIATSKIDNRAGTAIHDGSKGIDLFSIAPVHTTTNSRLARPSNSKRQ